jgi:hypothetical protein
MRFPLVARDGSFGPLVTGIENPVEATGGIQLSASRAGFSRTAVEGVKRTGASSRRVSLDALSQMGGWVSGLTNHSCEW